MAGTDWAHDMADRELLKLSRRFRATYKRAADDATEKAKDFFAAFEAKDAEQLKAVEAGQITMKDLQNWRTNQMLIGKRWTTLANDLTEIYAKVNADALSRTNAVLPEVYASNHNFAAYQIENGVSLNLDFQLYDAGTVQQLLRDTPRLLPLRDLDIEKDKLWNQKRITGELLQGILQGEPVGKIADRMQIVTDMNRASAMRNARTCVTGAESAGRIDSYKEANKKGIAVKKKWMATLDDRTRASHSDIDGETRPVDKPFSNGCMYPGDPAGPPAEVYNCRCTMIADLGVDEVEPVFRRARNAAGYTELVQDMSYSEWAKSKK